MQHLTTANRAHNINTLTAIHWAKHLVECEEQAQNLGIVFEQQSNSQYIAKWRQDGFDVQAVLSTVEKGWSEFGEDRYGQCSLEKCFESICIEWPDGWIEWFTPSTRNDSTEKVKHAVARAKSYGTEWRFLNIEVYVMSDTEILGFAEAPGFESDKPHNELVEEVLGLADQAIEEAKDKLTI